MTADAKAVLFLLIAAGLGACFIWAAWEFQQSRKRWRQNRRMRAFDRSTTETGRPLPGQFRNITRREKVSSRKEPNDFAGLITFGVIGAILLGLVVWQPKAAAWVAEAADAESSKLPGNSEPAALAAVPARKPIGPTAWTQVIDLSK